MLEQGFMRVGAATPRIRVGDCRHNAEQMLQLMGRAEREQIDLLVFPELGLTGYTCADLFQQEALHQGVQATLETFVSEGRSVYSGVAVIGVPMRVDDQLFNCAAVVQGGQILGIVPKSFIPNYKEFYEGRWFASAATARSETVLLHGVEVPFGTNLLFVAADVEGCILGVEICEDLWVPVPPSSFQALRGATLLANLSASNEVIGKSAYRRQLVMNQSARCMATYIYASCGVGESTTDVIFGGHCLIAENNTLLAESARFQRTSEMVVADTDLDRLRIDRVRTNSFGDAQLFLGVEREYRRLPFALARDSRRSAGVVTELRRPVAAHPFVPSEQKQLRERCEEIFSAQVMGLASRLEHLHKPGVVIGISGGLDSTLALLVACKTMDQLEVNRQKIQALTMPGFGTSQRTRSNAQVLMTHLGVTAREVDIRALCLEEMKAMGYRPFGIDLDGIDVTEFAGRLGGVPAAQRQDLTFENVQARMRTNILMNTGFVIGTGDLSELALGWCTYNGDHMSMYNPNVSIPKTLVKFLVRWAAENEFEGQARQTLLDIVATEISPELLPPGQNGEFVQSTEELIGPYELHDFFLFHFLRYGALPEKILYLAEHASFDRPYSRDEIRQWLRVFLKRFFAYQFKRSCLPDGPKVGSVSLSPRGDWRMPSDADARLWLERLDEASESQERQDAKAVSRH